MIITTVIQQPEAEERPFTPLNDPETQKKVQIKIILKFSTVVKMEKVRGKVAEAGRQKHKQ